MLLDIEILSGTRKGQVIRLGPAEDFTTLPYVLETEALKLSLVNSSGIRAAKLLLEDTTVELSPHYDSAGHPTAFVAMPAYKDNHLQALFYNYFGVALLYAELYTNAGVEIVELGQIEVLARKTSVDQIEAMIDFIIEEQNQDLLQARGATRRGGSVGDGGETPRRLMEQLEKHLELLDHILPHIMHTPLSSLTSKLKLERYNPGLDVGEQGISWLVDNLHVLETCNDREEMLLAWQGRTLKADKLQASVLFENRDIYENRIILGFFDQLLNFTGELLTGFREQETKQVSLNSHTGYVSFFTSVAYRLRVQSSHQIHRIHDVQEKIFSLRHTISDRFGVTKGDHSLPKFTAKVRANRHYSLLFRAIHEWYNSSAVNWDAYKLLLAIDSIPKLFELYTALLVRRWCATRGIENSRDTEIFWVGTLFGVRAALHYEPVYWMTGHVNHNGGAIYNTENRTLATANNDRLGKIRSHEFGHRCPDLVLELTLRDEKPVLIVMDAKYTTDKLAFEKYLPECTMKYVHGLASPKNSSLVAALFIFFPDLNMGSFQDFHAMPFDVFGDVPQLPMLGVQGLNFGVVGNSHFVELDKLLQRTLKTIQSNCA